jgi:hypothetical protein
VTCSWCPIARAAEDSAAATCSGDGEDEGSTRGEDDDDKDAPCKKARRIGIFSRQDMAENRDGDEMSFEESIACVSCTKSASQSTPAAAERWGGGVEGCSKGSTRG